MSAEDIINDFKKMAEEMSGPQKKIELTPEQESTLSPQDKVVILMGGLTPSEQQLVSLAALIKLVQEQKHLMSDEQQMEILEMAIMIYRGRVIIHFMSTLLPMLFQVVEKMEGGIAKTDAEIRAAQIIASLGKFGMDTDYDNEVNRQYLMKLLEPFKSIPPRDSNPYPEADFER